MSNDIRIKKGLDIKLNGEAEKTVEQAIISNYCTVRPEDFHGVIPKLIAKEGATVQAGDTLFFDKANENVKFSSPVSGKIVEVVRGPKRRIDALKIESDKTQSYKDYGKFNVDTAKAEEVTAGGIYIPDTAKEKPQRGTVVSVSEVDGDGNKPAVKEGDTVLYGKYSGTELEFEGRELLIMRESDILAIV